MELHVLIEERRWLEINLRKILSGVIKSVLSFLNNCESNYEISLLASNDKNISELNKKYRNVRSATNILSWPEYSLKNLLPGKMPKTLPVPGNGNSTISLGNLAIAYETCKKEAKINGISLESHMSHILLHGFLHLVGFDHHNDLDAELMEGIEVSLLSSLGIPNPYNLREFNR
tara:strand:+ start:285 stop:806 length:522 start_codon:yes stop_codon:yes gene_type:complete